MSYSPRRAAPSSSKTETKPKTNVKYNGSADDKKKKKILTIAIVAVLGVVIVVSLLFIFAPSDGSVLGIRGSGVLSGGNNGGSPGSSNGAVAAGETQDGTTIISTYYKDGILPTAADRHDITLVPDGGANVSDLYGTWKLDQGTTYIFDGKGKGMMLTGVDNYSFNYSAENGKLGIDMDTIAGNDYEYEYTVNGDTLTMTRGGNTYTLTKTADQ